MIDKDDVKDVLDGHAPDAGELAYEVMFSVARRQIALGLSTICDGPLVSQRAYDQARAVATAEGVMLLGVECRCSNPAVWQQRIEQRRELGLPAYYQTSWAGLQAYLRHAEGQARYMISTPVFVVETSRPLTTVWRRFAPGSCIKASTLTSAATDVTSDPRLTFRPGDPRRHAATHRSV